MKFFLLGLLVSFSTGIIAQQKLNYQIIERQTNAPVPEDSLLIFGKVIYDKTPAKDNFGKISTLNFKTAIVVQRSGNFEIMIHKSTKGIYFYQQGYREVVINFNEIAWFNQLELNITGETYFSEILIEKPVIYCYSPEPVKTEIYLNPKGDLTFTYPAYHQKWEIQTTENEQIQDLNTGKTHPYLFWEAQQNKLDFIKSNQSSGINGFIIQTDTVIPFLEHQLSQLGLNDKEATDFITYWGPRLMQQNYALIQFIVNDDYNSVFGTIEFSQQPDCLQRVGMLFSNLEQVPQNFKITPQTFEPIQRKGFTVIEWGGAEIKKSGQ